MIYFARFTLLTAILLLAIAVAQAQRVRCVLSKEQAPQLGGLKLGMTPGEVSARFNVIDLALEEDLGVINMALRPAEDSHGDMGSIKLLGLEFVDSKLIQIEASYNPIPGMKEHKQLAQRIAARLKLPPVWDVVKVGESEVARRLRCNGFELTALVIGPLPQLTLTDLDGRALVEQRKAEKNRRK